jgi:hypothetical protein
MNWVAVSFWIGLFLLYVGATAYLFVSPSIGAGVAICLGVFGVALSAIYAAVDGEQ